jgi:hypothetical protein
MSDSRSTTVKYEERRKVEEGWMERRVDIAALAYQGLGGWTSR